MVSRKAEHEAFIAAFGCAPWPDKKCIQLLVKGDAQHVFSTFSVDEAKRSFPISNLDPLPGWIRRLRAEQRMAVRRRRNDRQQRAAAAAHNSDATE